ncbi:MAG: zf-HC2 domain-containing protein [Myxococcota bacterium]|nr:zf-HC2 domain-containing protein [Myxococcota bacterium]
MSCARSERIDLLAFLEAPRDAAFDDFREHYPRCRACAAEVRAWTELHAALRAGAAEPAHPGPELLARYEEDPGALAPEARARISAHVAACPACRDELRALRAFDPAALAAPARRPPRAAPARPSRGWLGALGRLVWHPAFAYALVGLLLFPVLYRTALPPLAREPAAAPEPIARRSMPEPDSFEGAPSPASGRSVPEPSSRPERFAVRTEDTKATANAPRVRRLERALEAPEPERVPLPAAPASPAPEKRELAAAEAPARVAALEQLGEGEVDVPEAQQAPPDLGSVARRLDAAAEAVDEERLRGMTRQRAAPAEPRVRFRAQPDPEANALAAAVADALAARSPPRAGQVVVADEPQVGVPALVALRGFRLQVPLGPDLAGPAEVEVRVTGPDGRRELRERLQIEPGVRSAELEIPPRWLGAGRHRVELRAAGEPAATLVRSIERVP